jgi:hypothetical protein
MSPETQAALVRTLTEFTHAEISTIALEFGVDEKVSGYTKADRSYQFVRAVKDGLGESALIRLAGRRLELFTEWQIQNVDSASALLRALEFDGYAFDGKKLLPTTPAPAALGRESSKLEEQLKDIGLSIATTHYRQVLANFVAGHFEAANGQLRAFLESLFLEMCFRQTSKKLKDASAALQHLRNTDFIDDNEWNQYRAFWGAIQTNGPHHGLTSQSEPIYRLQCGTAIARYLLTKFR